MVALPSIIRPRRGSGRWRPVLIVSAVGSTKVTRGGKGSRGRWVFFFFFFWRKGHGVECFEPIVTVSYSSQLITLAFGERFDDVSDAGPIGIDQLPGLGFGYRGVCFQKVSNVNGLS